MDTFEWLPTECADERYPMQLIGGSLRCADGSDVPVPSGKIVNNGWGEIGSRRLVGAARKSVPERLELAWFSYTEDRFFMGEVELPKAELLELFQNGFRQPVTRAFATWSKVIVGMGLGGWTNVWLGGSGLVREVASAKLEPAEIDWAEVLDNPAIDRADFIRAKLRSRLSDAALRAQQKHGPPVDAWPRYAKRHRWRLLVEGLQVPLDVFVRCFNGDRHWFDFARQPPGELGTAPKQLDITWLTRKRTKILTRIALDEDEAFDAIARATRAHPSATLTLHVDLAARGRVTLAVEANKERFRIERASVDLRSLAS